MLQRFLLLSLIPYVFLSMDAQAQMPPIQTPKEISEPAPKQPEQADSTATVPAPVETPTSKNSLEVRLKQLEDENRKLKQLVADLSLDKHILQDVLAKKL